MNTESTASIGRGEFGSGFTGSGRAARTRVLSAMAVQVRNMVHLDRSVDSLFRPVQALIDDVLRRDRAQRLRNVAAAAQIQAAGGRGPADGIRDDPLHAGIVVDGKGLVARAEIDDLAL